MRSLVAADAAGVGWEPQSEKSVCWKRMPAGEHVYGLEQKTTSLDKRGLAFEMWNTDPQNYAPGDDPIYSSIPFYLGLNDGRGYGIFFDNSARGHFDFGAQTPGITRFEAECGERNVHPRCLWRQRDRLCDLFVADGLRRTCGMRYYFFYGPRLTAVLDRYTELTGRMVMPPLWTLGYHQNRWSYYPEARVREIARQFREQHIPLCDLWSPVRRSTWTSTI